MLRLFVLAPTRYRTTKAHYYYRQKAYVLSDDNETPARTLLQAYFDRWAIEVNHRDEKSILGVGQGQVWSKLSALRLPALRVASYSLPVLSALQKPTGRRGPLGATHGGLSGSVRGGLEQ